MSSAARVGAALVTNAPEITDPPHVIPTGNLWVSLPEIDRDDGTVAAIGVLSERTLGLVEARGTPEVPLIRPELTVDDRPVPIESLTWQRRGHWLPHFTAVLPSGTLDGFLAAPGDERGVVLRLTYRSSGPTDSVVRLGWSGTWASTTLTHLRSRTIGEPPRGEDDPWTGSRTVSVTAGIPLLAVAWQAGAGMELAELGPDPSWLAVGHHSVHPGESLTADLFVGVATEPDGSAATALHLRRRGFDALWEETIGWLEERALPVTRAAPEPRPGLADAINGNLYFNYFFAQGNCLDTGRPVIVTSRSRQYYVSAAFWSRDAYCWTFPALLLVDPDRSRQVLVASLAAAGPRVADHALYLNGTSLYPGFELDQAAAPVLAIWRYVAATGDRSVLAEPAVQTTLAGLPSAVAPWRHPEWDLYGTFLLPTDDPTDFIYVTTSNALLAVAFEATADLLDGAGSDGGRSATDHRDRAQSIRAALGRHLLFDSADGPSWAWACDRAGSTERRDEPPLGLRTLPYWGIGRPDDAHHRATRSWLTTSNPHWYEGRFGGAGAPHFPHPTGFDLANRLMVDGRGPDGTTGTDPLAQLAATPMDEGLACESWDADTGRVRTGAAMASMGGLLAWTAWEHLTGRRRWDQPSPELKDPKPPNQ